MADIEIETAMPSTAFEGIMIGAQNAARLAQTAQASTSRDAMAASLAASGAIAANGRLFPDTPTGLAATAEGDFFSVVGDDTATYAILYHKLQGAAVEQASYASKAAWQGPGGAGMVGYKIRTVLEKLDEWVSVKDFGAKGDGVTDDTAAIQAAFEYAQANQRTVWFPDGVYLVGNLLFGSNEIRAKGNNPAPLGMLGQSNQGVTLLAKPGTTGTVLQAWSMAATTFANFTVNGNGLPIKLIDWDWKAEVGPSTLNVIYNIRGINCPGADVAISLDNLNDTTPDRLYAFTGGDDSKVGIRARQSGGMVKFTNCQSVGAYWDINGQNIVLDHCLDAGIQLTSGADNIFIRIGGQSYGNRTTLTCIWCDLKTLNSGIMGLKIIGTYFPLGATVTSILNLNIYAALIELEHCVFIAKGVYLLHTFCTSSSSQPVRVVVRGGANISTDTTTMGARLPAVIFTDTHNVNGSCISIAQGVIDNTTAAPVDKHWDTDLSVAVTLEGNTAPIDVKGIARRSMDDTITFWLQLNIPANATSGQPFVLHGLPFAGIVGFRRPLARGQGSAPFAGATFDLDGERVVGWNPDGTPLMVPASSAIGISGTYSAPA